MEEDGGDRPQVQVAWQRKEKETISNPDTVLKVSKAEERRENPLQKRKFEEPMRRGRGDESAPMGARVVVTRTGLLPLTSLRSSLLVLFLHLLNAFVLFYLQPLLTISFRLQIINFISVLLRVSVNVCVYTSPTETQEIREIHRRKIY